MKHVIKHSLSDELARTATKKAFESYAERFADYDPRADWLTEDRANVSFNAKGIKLGGTVTLRPREVELDMDVPFAFRIFQKKAIAVIDEEITKWLRLAENGEFDEDGEEGEDEAMA